MTFIELATKLASALSALDAATIAINSGLAGAKDLYLGRVKEIGVSVKDANNIWKAVEAEINPKSERASKKGFADSYYNWLAEEERSEEEALNWLVENGSNNTRNQLPLWLNIWALSASIWRQESVKRTLGGKAPKAETETESEPEDNWEYDDAHPFESVRSAWENLKRETAKAKPRRTRLHPDKVDKFKDEELKAAYNKAFQTYCSK